MEENNVETSTQETNEKFTPIMCPHCKSKNLAFITEYHKSIGGRILFSLFLTVSIALLLFLFKDYTEILMVLDIIATILTLITGIYVVVVESETHIQCICKDCGFDWLKN